MPKTFFLLNEPTDPQYKAVRDRPDAEHFRAEIETLWQDYRPYADAKFREEATRHFHERYWEMYVAVALLRKNFELTKHGDAGPEFSFSLNGRRVWVEAVAPTGGDGPDAVKSYGPKQPMVPVEQVLLRFTNAFETKRRCYVNAVNKKIISPDDAYVIAVNSRGVPHGSYSGTIPFYIQALLPIGPLTLILNAKTMRAVDQYYQHRPEVEKMSQAKVSTRWFLEATSVFCSAVLHSSIDVANQPTQIGGDFSVLHNPSAAHKLDSSAFTWCEQFHFSEDMLYRTESA